jgi:hypothetical protein
MANVLATFDQQAAGSRSSPPFMSTRQPEHRAAGYETR